MKAQISATVARVAPNIRILGPDLGSDLQRRLKEAMSTRTVVALGRSPAALFRGAVAATIRDIETHPRGLIFQKFLKDGPYEYPGEIPPEFVTTRLSDADVARAISFIYGHMINCFQGALAELLAIDAALRILRTLQTEGTVSPDTRLFVGDVVAARGDMGGLKKAADMHLLSANTRIEGVVEVKSFTTSHQRLLPQLEKHLRRATGRLSIRRGGEWREIPAVARSGTIRISIVPSGWRLPRTFNFVKNERGRVLRVDHRAPPTPNDRIERLGPTDWHVELRWSQEALAAQAYELTFAYMAAVGEAIYRDGVPSEWSQMTAAQAGQNAAKMMLYYSILRSRTAREQHRATTLYNAYGFGYALGSAFVDEHGRREMLWPEDLDQILESGRTEAGARLIS